jgi:hypothetical protein
VFPDGEGVAMGNGHDVTIQNNDINDGYHAGVSICTKGCYSNQWLGNGIKIITQYNHIWNVMQGITSDGGALYYDIGGSQGSGTGDQILNNLVHDVTDAGIIDAGVVGSGYGGHGIYLDIQSSGVNVENNVLFRIGVSGLTMTQGPAAGKPANTFNNNIVAFARKAMYEDQNPWPNNCTNNLMANITHNIFYFDLDDRSSFYAINGCTDSCGMTYNNYQNFSGNLYWRTDGGFSNYDKAFHVLNSPPPPNQASTCPNVQGQNAFTYFGFSEWQNGAPLVNGQPLQMNEDKGGTVTVNPNFGDSGQASDFLLVQSPMEGFNSSETNNTVNSAGRNDPVIVVPAVPGTYPTYYFTNF